MHSGRCRGARELSTWEMVLHRSDSDGFLSDGERELPVPSGLSSSAALSAAELVKTKKCSTEEKQAKKPCLQLGGWEETCTPRVEITSDCCSTGTESAIMRPLQPFSETGDTRCPQTSAVPGDQKEAPSSQASKTLQSELPPEILYLFKKFMREEMHSFCQGGTDSCGFSPQHFLSSTAQG